MIKYLFYIILILCVLKYYQLKLNNNIVVISLIIILGLYIIDLILKNNIEKFTEVGIFDNTYYVSIRTVNNDNKIGERLDNKLFKTTTTNFKFLYYSFVQFYKDKIAYTPYIKIYIPIDFYFLAIYSDFHSESISYGNYYYCSPKSILNTSDKLENTDGFIIPSKILNIKVSTLFVFKNYLTIANNNAQYFVIFLHAINSNSLGTLNSEIDIITNMLDLPNNAGGTENQTKGYIRFSKSIDDGTSYTQFGKLIEFTNISENDTKLLNLKYKVINYVINYVKFGDSYNKVRTPVINIYGIVDYIKDNLTSSEQDSANTIIKIMIPNTYCLYAYYGVNRDLCYCSIKGKPVTIAYKIGNNILNKILICKTINSMIFNNTANITNSTNSSSTGNGIPMEFE